MTQTASSASVAAPLYEEIDDFREWGIRALVTTRHAGSFSMASTEPAASVLARWDTLQRDLFPDPSATRLATARQVHGAEVLVHDGGWRGWLRGPEADGHLALARGTAMAVSVADCVPVFVAHPSGAAAVLHSGWRGTVANILAVAVRTLAEAGVTPSELRVVVGPAICGDCYEVSADVFEHLTGRSVDRATRIDLRAVIAAQASVLGIRDVRALNACTRCDNDRFYSHRGGDAGRQIGVLLAEP